MIRILAVAACLLCVTCPITHAAHLGMGVRVGDVNHSSAVVWTRVTAEPSRRNEGYRDPPGNEPKSDEYVPSEIEVDDREGAMPGALGEVRISVADNADFSNAVVTNWLPVHEADDYVLKTHIACLAPGVLHHVRVDVRDEGETEVDESRTVTFTTPAEADQWQDAAFGVVTGMMYKDLDHPEGFEIYESMARDELDFLVLTGDTVYYDNEPPRARTIELARHHWHRMNSLPRHITFHEQVPGYWEVDDHDSFCDDCWPTMRATFMSPLTFDDGYRIFREQNPVGPQPYRTIRWGQGLQIWIVEGRLFRSPNRDPDGPDKTIWGAEQLDWLKESILESDADFRVLISPTPIVGPDRGSKADNHSNDAFATEGNAFRQWTADEGLTNFFVCCGDRHWQYLSIDPATGLREFSCGPASDQHAGGSPGADAEYQPFHRVAGGYLTVRVQQDDAERPTILFQHHAVDGEIAYEFEPTAE